MDKDKALQIVANALNLANQKGAFDLNTSATVFAALTAVQGALADRKEPEAKQEPGK